MQIGVPREIKSQEYRVGLTPASARELARRGHQVLIETQAGAAVGLPDEAYMVAGATVCGDAREVWSRADMIIKVKEPQAAERAMLRPGQILYAYLHLAPDREQAMALIASGAVCIAYETSRSIRADASRPRAPRRTRSPPTSSTVWCTTAWQTCPAQCRERRPSR